MAFTALWVSLRKQSRLALFIYRIDKLSRQLFYFSNAIQRQMFSLVTWNKEFKFIVIVFHAISFVCLQANTGVVCIYVYFMRKTTKTVLLFCWLKVANINLFWSKLIGCIPLGTLIHFLIQKASTLLVFQIIVQAERYTVSFYIDNSTTLLQIELNISTSPNDD